MEEIETPTKKTSQGKLSGFKGATVLLKIFHQDFYRFPVSFIFLCPSPPQ